MKFKTIDSFADLVREAQRHGMIDDPARWMHYRELRNATSHVYMHEKAELVIDEAEEFAQNGERIVAAIRRTSS